MVEGEVAAPVATGDFDRQPRTARGRATRRKILDAAAQEFGDKGFHESSIVSITQRAGVALGSFYTYFESKDELFRALVRDRSDGVRESVAPIFAEHEPTLDREGLALGAFLRFARDHKELYRIIDEAEFVAPEAWREHYSSTAGRILDRYKELHRAGAVREVSEVEAWAIMGMNVFLGLRFGVQSDDADLDLVTERGIEFVKHGLSPRHAPA